MNSLQIYKILSHDPVSTRYFAGAFLSDKIFVIQTFPDAMIINSYKHDKKGSHWMAVCIQDQKTLQFFDFFGLPSEIYGEDFTRFTKQYPRRQWIKTPLKKMK